MESWECLLQTLLDPRLPLRFSLGRSGGGGLENLLALPSARVSLLQGPLLETH